MSQTDPNKHFCQVWEGDYARRGPFIDALNEVNNFPRGSLTGFSVWWSDIPYSLALFAMLYFDSASEQSEEFAIQASDVLRRGGGRLRSDITGEELQRAANQRQLNMRGMIEGFPLQDPCQWFTLESLERKGYRFNDWRAKTRVFLSHQNERKREVSILQQLLASHGVSTWMDIHDIDYGDPLAVAIDEGIRDSTAVVFWISDGFLRSQWCRFEFEGFLDRHARDSLVKLLPVVEKGCEGRLPSRLTSLKYLSTDQPGDPHKVAAELASAIKHTHSPIVDTKYWS